MTATFLRRIILLLFAAVTLLPVAAQETTTTTPATSTATSTATTSTQAPTVVANIDSAETREQLNELLRRLPPQVGKTLKLDPTLWSNPGYLANYPALASFIAAHPEVPHSPAYYLERIWIPGDVSPETQSYRIWNNLIETISFFSGFLIFGGLFIWLIKTIIDHKRWNRLSRIHTEVHNKLLDRFQANEDLLKYIETPAGRHFLESAPIPLEAEPRAVAAPIGRVLWSVQVGIVLAAAGVGLKFVSLGLDKEVSQPLSALGVLGIAIGGGFIIAAAVSFILSRRLGLWQPADAEAAAGE